MIEKKSCIYEIYSWMGVVGKYTGCFPLPGLYEKNEWSKWTKGFINYVIPALNFSVCFFGVVAMFVDYSRRFQRDLTDLLAVIIDYSNGLHYGLSLLMTHFRLRRNLVSYLKQYERLNELLEPAKIQLKRLIGLFFSVLISLQCFLLLLARHDNNRSKYEPSYNSLSLSELIIRGVIQVSMSFIISFSMSTHPQLMYIVFQHILKTAFDELFRKIKRNENKNLSGKMRVKQMRKYMRFYCDLCKLSTRLDRMVSPLLLICLLQHYIEQIFSFTFLTRSFSVANYARLLSIVLRCFSLILVPNCAYLTKKSSAIHATFKPDDKIMQTELQHFALQSMCFDKPFSASDFIQLDRELIVTIFNSIVSQVVVFYKIHTEKV